jgi:hypothetical protein
MTDRDRYRREAYAFFREYDPEVEIGPIGRSLLNMPTPPLPPSGAPHSPSASSEAQPASSPEIIASPQESGEAGAIDLTDSPVQTSPLARQAASRKRKTGAGQQGTLEGFFGSDRNTVRPASLPARGDTAQAAAPQAPIQPEEGGN